MKKKLKSALVFTWRLAQDWAIGLWEAICWIIAPCAFGYLAYLSIHKKDEVSLMGVTLVLLALLPFLLKLLSRYLSEFNVGPSGVSGKTREGVINKDEIEKKPTIVTAINTKPDTSTAALKEDKFDLLLPQTKKVLRTLWKFQVEQFGPDDARRWGFGVGTGASDYLDFSLGLLELLKSRFVALDARGLVFLSNEGVQFCKEYSPEISAYPIFYDKFGSS